MSGLSITKLFTASGVITLPESFIVSGGQNVVYPCRARLRETCTTGAGNAVTARQERMLSDTELASEKCLLVPLMSG
jgi:hypothetical protein